LNLSVSAALLQCGEGAVASHQTAGDHRLYLGLVVAASTQPVPPLVYHGGRYHLLGEIL